MPMHESASRHDPHPGPAKEGIVLDANDQPIHATGRSTSGGGAQIRVYRGGWWLPIVLGVGIPALLVFGIFVFTVLMTLGIFLFFIRSLFGAGKRHSG